MFDHAALEARASVLAGTPVTITCQAPAAFRRDGNLVDEDGIVQGFVLTDPVTGKFIPKIHMRSKLCADLSTLGSHANRNIWDVTNPKDQGYGPMADYTDGLALAVLEHEAIHIRSGSYDEGYVECEAYRNRWAAIDQFKPMKAWKLKQIYWGMKIAHQQTLPEYRVVC